MSDDFLAALVPGRDILGKRSLRDRDYRVKTYDFRRPDKFSKEQIRTVEIIHESFARLAVVSLSSCLRLPCEMTLRLVDQMTFQEFMDSLSAPTVLCALALPPLAGLALLHFDIELREALIERGFGGAAGSPDPELAARDLTDIEVAAFEKLAEPLATDLGKAWIQLVDSKPRLASIETDPRFCQIVPPSEMILLVELEAKIGGRSGMMHIVFPYLVIEPLERKLRAEYWYSAEHPAEAGSIPPSVAWGIETAAELVVEGAKLRIGELHSLRRGSLVAIPGLDQGAGRLRAGGRELLRLRLAERRRDGTLALDALPGGKEAEIPGLDLEEGRTGLERGLEGLERRLAGLKESLEGTMRNLGARFDEMEGRQESFADRLAYGGADAGTEEGRDAEKRPFAALASTSPEFLSLFFAAERPQVAALVLAWLDDSLASRVLDGLPPAAQTEVVRRLATLDWVSPSIVAVADRVLAKKLAAMGSERRVPGGLQKIVGLLNLSRRATEKNVVESLERLDPALAEEIKKNMFVFEDICLLDVESIALLLGRADEADIVLGLKPLDGSTRERVLARFEPAAAARLLARAEAMGRVRLSECDAAGQRVVETVRRLEEEGLIVLARGDS